MSRAPSGPMRHKVTVLSPSTARDSDTGEPTHSSTAWGTHATVWARFRSLQGQERFAAQQNYGTVTHELETRYASTLALTSDKRVKKGSRYFDIKAAMNVDERNRVYRLLVEERA